MQQDHRLIADLLRQHQFSEAYVNAKQLIDKGDNSEFIWSLLIQALRLDRKLKSCIDAIQLAITKFPEQISFLLELANAYYLTNDFLNCHNTLGRIQIESNNISRDDINLTGILYNRIGYHEEALIIFKEANYRYPDDPQILFNLGDTHRYCGNFDISTKYYSQAIKIDNHYYSAYLERSRTSSQTKRLNHINEMEALLNAGVKNKSGAIKLLYALAKEYEDIEDYQRSFINVLRGAELKHGQQTYNIETDERLVDIVIDQYTDEFINSNEPGFDSTEPIFIIGMPRTGTTLVERILGSHSEVYPAGELYNLSQQLHKTVPFHGINQELFTFISSSLIHASANIDAKLFGERYVASTRPRTGHTKHFTDKLPLNYYYCGLIKRTLPKSKIVHVTRHPLDTCYSNFKYLFSEGAFQFSYDLQDIARYYLSYKRLMDHWNKIMPFHIYSVDYEALIEDPEKETQYLLNYCDLDWEDSCLNFYNNTTPTSSASAVQVRQPLYSSSIQNWQHYAAQLEPLKNYLISNGISI